MKSLILDDIFAAYQHFGDAEGAVHQKALPCFSVVQSLHGHYDIGLNGQPVHKTNEGDVFVTAPGDWQNITHHNGAGGYMQAQWVFFSATADGKPLEQTLSFPTVLPADANAAIRERLQAVISADNLCRRYAAAYGLAELLLPYGIPADRPDPAMLRLREIVLRRFDERLTAEDIAEEMHCSASQVFRMTRRYFGKTPAHYINHIRLQKAAQLLEQEETAIKEIAFICGFYDTAYFSHLFSQAFLCSPGEYRRRQRKQR